MHFLLWTKRSNENTNFDTFKCYGENWPNPRIDELLNCFYGMVDQVKAFSLISSRDNCHLFLCEQ